MGSSLRSFPTQKILEFLDSTHHQCSFSLVYPHLPAGLGHYILVGIRLDTVGKYSDSILVLYY